MNIKSLDVITISHLGQIEKSFTAQQSTINKFGLCTFSIVDIKIIDNQHFQSKDLFSFIEKSSNICQMTRLFKQKRHV